MHTNSQCVFVCFGGGGVVSGGGGVVLLLFSVVVFCLFSNSLMASLHSITFQSLISSYNRRVKNIWASKRFW